MNKALRIMGIDVGFAINGWSIIDKSPEYKNGMNLVDFGAITTEAGGRIENRLMRVYDDLDELIKRYTPDIMAVENLFFSNNQKTAIDVAQMRGVILLAGEQNGLEVFGYTPLQVKTSVTGYGKADKKQVQKMVKMIFGLKEIPKPDDAADAVAVGLCHLNSMSLLNSKLSSIKKG